MKSTGNKPAQVNGVSLEDVKETFDLLEDWEDRYRYLIDLGRKLPPFPEKARTESNKVRGCVSQVWLVPHISSDHKKTFFFEGDSDAHIVRGLIAVLMLIFNGKTPEEIVETDAKNTLETLGLARHLSPMRTNGLYSMVRRIQDIAKASLAPS